MQNVQLRRPAEPLRSRPCGPRLPGCARSQWRTSANLGIRDARRPVQRSRPPESVSTPVHPDTEVAEHSEGSGAELLPPQNHDTDIRMPPLGPVGWARWAWRQVTSMRSALFLLFMLALGAVPGSVFPQRGVNPADVQAYIAGHPVAGRWLDRLSMFDVFGSAWFAAIYLLLLISVVGCVVPRSILHAKAIRARPPAAPRNLARLPEHRSYQTWSGPESVLDDAAEALRQRRWRVDIRDGAVSAERGQTRETGNLIFHAALILLLLGIALGALFGTRGQVLVVDGGTFSNTVTGYDSFSAGRAANRSALPPFSFTMTKFRASYEPAGPQKGAPRSFEADLLVRDDPNASARPVKVQVNEPLVVGGTKVFLIGHGYAPHVTVRDGQGRVVLSSAVVFLPRDSSFLSTGVIKVPDARPAQLGFRGLFLPTAAFDPGRGGVSTFPAADSPALLLTAFSGKLGLDNGVPQSVYTLDTSNMSQVAGKGLRVGDTWTLPDNLGSVTFDRVEEFATFNLADDPGKDPVFVASMLALTGLMISLFVRRRRVWVRATPQDDGPTLVEIGALARTEASGVGDVVDDLLARLQSAAPETALETHISPATEESR